MRLVLIISVAVLYSLQAIGQTFNKSELNKIISEGKAESLKQQTLIKQYCEQTGKPKSEFLPTGVYREIVAISPDGQPQYLITHDNLRAAQAINADKLWTGTTNPYQVTGRGMTVGVWDGGTGLATHVEFGKRLILKEASGAQFHATHVCGTVGARGAQSRAKGMAPEVTIHSYNWSDDIPELAAAAQEGLLVSNHSYGTPMGWTYDGGWSWGGNSNISNQEDYKFGMYDNTARSWDNMLFSAPYLLSCVSAGNDRNEGPNSGFPKDGPYDCIGDRAVAKNVLTVGAVNAFNSQGYFGPAAVIMSSFSCWGPVDDGRIKPDLVAVGVNVYSTSNSSNTSYGQSSGTSMSSPSAAGGLILLQNLYTNKNKGKAMRASTLKALALGTTREAGTTAGPDYQFGWGLLNTQLASDVILGDSVTSLIREFTILQGDSLVLFVTKAANQPLSATLCWTDPRGPSMPNMLDNPTPALVNNLDLRVTDTLTNITTLPWKLNPAIPQAAATKGLNDVDNVEKVEVTDNNANQAVYRVVVRHRGNLQNGKQVASLVIHGIVTPLYQTFSCRGTTYYTASSGKFDDGSGTGVYFPNSRCVFTIRNFDSLGIIKGTFENFDLATGDTLYVYNNENATGTPSTAFYLGNLPTASLVSTGRFLTFVFATDANNQAQGWTFKYDLLQAPSADFSSPERACAGVAFQVSAYGTGESTAGYVYNWETPSAETVFQTDPLTYFTINTPGKHKIKLKVSNEANTLNLEKEILVEGSVHAPTTNSFEGTNPMAIDTINQTEWTALPDLNGTAWQVGSFAATAGSSCLAVSNASNTIGLNKSLLSPQIDISTLDTAYLFFDYAYAKRTNSSDVYLEVAFSQDCGISFPFSSTIIGSDIETAPLTASNFIPTASQWKTFSVDLRNFATNKTRINIRVVNSSASNFLFIDNIQIGKRRNDGTTSFVRNNSLQNVSLYPNPAFNRFDLTIDALISQNITIDLLDIQGKKIASQESRIDVGKNQFSSEYINGNQKLAPGTYIIRVSGNTFVPFTQRLIISQ